MRDQTFDFVKAMTVRQLLDKLQVLPESVVVVRNDEILTEDEVIKAPETVEIIPVISGGVGHEM